MTASPQYVSGSSAPCSIWSSLEWSDSSSLTIPTGLEKRISWLATRAYTTQLRMAPKVRSEDFQSHSKVSLLGKSAIRIMEERCQSKGRHLDQVNYASSKCNYCTKKPQAHTSFLWKGSNCQNTPKIGHLHHCKPKWATFSYSSVSTSPFRNSALAANYLMPADVSFKACCKCY